MAVTITYDWQLVQNIDLAAGPTRQDVDVTSLANGGFAAVGTVDSSYPADTSAIDIFNANLTSAGGRTGIGGQSAEIGQLSNGNLVVLTNDYEFFNPYTNARFTILNATGGVVKAATEVFTASPAFDSEFPARLATLANGGFAVVGRNYNTDGLSIDVYNNAGTFLTQVSIGANDSHYESHAAITALDDGGFAVAWEDHYPGGYYVRSAAFNFDGTPRSAGGTLLPLGDAIGPGEIDICATNEGYALVFDQGTAATGRHVQLARFHSNSNFIDSVTLSSNSAHGHSPVVTRMPDGLLAVAMDYSLVGPNDSEIFLGLYDPQSQSFVAQRTVTAGEVIADDTDDPAIAAHGRGQLAIFHTNRTDNDADGEDLRVVRTHSGDAESDFMTAGDYSEEFLGGGGVDTVWYLFLAHGVNVNLSLTTAQHVGNGKIDRFSSIEDVVGSHFADVLIGTSGNNRLDGASGTDSLRGGTGHDIYDNPDQADQIVELAGQGTDTVYTNQSAYSLAAVANVENLTYEYVMYNDWNFTGTGNSLDNIITSHLTLQSFGDDTLSGLGGRDTIYGGYNNDIISGGDGDDIRLDGGHGVDRIFGGLGNDRIDGGTEGDTALNGDAGNDTITGGDGDDVANGGDNDDKLYGQNGRDTLRGGNGVDTLYGGDEMVAGDILLAGDAGADHIQGGLGGDRIDGGTENDRLYGEAGNDTVTGGFGNDRLEGGADVDVLFGEADNDYILGGTGIDTLYGASGLDYLYGDADNDFLQGDGGNDNLYGGLGLDRFNFDPANGSDVIFDFTNDQDTLIIDPLFGLANAAAVVAATIQTGTHARILLPGADTDIYLWNYLAAGSGNSIGNLSDDIMIA